MEIFSTPPSQTLTTTTRNSHSTKLLPRCSPRFAASPFAVAILLLFLTAAAAAAGVSYSDHCNDIVREPPLLPEPNLPLINRRFLAILHAHVGCTVNRTTNKDICVVPGSLAFSARKAYRTQQEAVFKIEEARLSLFDVGNSPNISRRGLRLVHFRPPRYPVFHGPSNSITFSLNGFWDSGSGKICLIGSGSGKSSSNNVVLKLDYLNSSSIFTSLVNGTLESLDINDEIGFNLNSISILGVNLRNNYKYELIDKESESNGFHFSDDLSSVSLGVEDLGQKLCEYILSAGIYELEYKDDCNSVNCNFLGRGNNNNNFMPSVMYLTRIECLDDGRVRFLLGFGDNGRNGYRSSFQPNTTLVSEGKWDPKQKRLNMVGCRIFSDWDEGFVGECLIRLSLRFPAKWTLRDRSIVVGELWSSTSVNETGYFGRVMLSSVRNNDMRTPGLSYEYTEIENTKRICANKTIQKGERKMYPKALSSDMRFDMLASNKKNMDLWGYSSPLFVGSQHHHLSAFYGGPSIFGRQHQNLSNLLNVSYGLNVTTSHDFKLSSVHKKIQSFDISAEGTYNSESGHVCMIGCMQVGPPKVSVGRSLDCEIVVDIQYHPVNTNNGETVKGTIKSTREKSDGLYFEPFEITSRLIYQKQVWRMDLEITMVLISNTLSFIFVGLQLLHVKRHANVLPLISVVMLIVLTLGHLIPLLLNFEALFTRRRNSGDEWLEVNEVLVRVITMIAFLLKFRLLQMAWSSRSADEGQKNLWTPDKKVLYIGGALIAWFVHLWREPYESPQVTHRFGYKKPSLWGDLKSYGGLILDGFLLPQILFNLFCDSKEKVLAPSFYVGTSVVRLLPHAYDLYRSHSSTWSFRNIYANPRLDYYSTAWDIIISVGGFLCVVLIYLQQRYGGQCLIPRRLWRGSTYEKVPVAGPE
ncbi:hypothetical protein PHJA_002776700 [Phtheirospermum japonicum]|uniref:RING-type E3 ubiquitin transferase n=1 Tax=Phtheirospermum japonicum TaxID=374723 RepID=A0A830D3U5_9LAMI|nr:hypothetical protein PHJA_002776700 [Phtheirospermum japonicum]